jgi:ribosomal protein L7/L12
MQESALTVEDLIALLRRKIASATINPTDRVIWNHKEWGFVDICDVVVPVADDDPGLVGTVALKPMKHIPIEKTDHYFNIVVESVRADMKIAGIKAFRMVDSVRGKGMGLAEAKAAVESIRIGYPFVFERILPIHIKACEKELRGVGGMQWHTQELGKDEDDLIEEMPEDSVDPVAHNNWMGKPVQPGVPPAPKSLAPSDILDWLDISQANINTTSNTGKNAPMSHDDWLDDIVDPPRNH